MTLEFRVVDGDIDGLPANYLPAALPHLQDPDLPFGRQLFSLPGFASTEFIPGARIADPVGLAACVCKAAEMVGDVRQPVFLGPPVEPGHRMRVLRPKAVPHYRKIGPRPVAVGIIDTGISFWNPVFTRQTPGGIEPAFAGMVMQEFAPTGVPHSAVLSEAEIAMRCQQARQPGGDHAIRAAFAQLYPGTIYGQNRPGGSQARPDALLHGTAMAWLAWKQMADQEIRPRLFGAELPIEAVMDSSGDTLQAIIALSVANLVTAIRDHPAHAAGVRIILALSLAFTGGPQDRDHPMLRAIEAVLDNLGGDVTLVLPRGNHLQDQCHARLTSGAEPQVWHVPHDDHSPNTIEFVLPGPGIARTRLIAPDGSAAQVLLGPTGLALLWHRGRIIGALWRIPLPGGRGRMRLVLAQTAATGRQNLPLAPAGDWRFSVRLRGGGDLNAWVLRDDLPLFSPALPPRRRSWLRDAHYLRWDPKGGPQRTDPPGTLSRVLRAGTASVMSTVHGGRLVPVTAHESLGSGPQRPAGYAGLPLGPGVADAVLVDDGLPDRGQWVIGNGSARPFRLSGTSVAAAIHAGTMAAALALQP